MYIYIYSSIMGWNTAVWVWVNIIIGPPKWIHYQCLASIDGPKVPCSRIDGGSSAPKNLWECKALRHLLYFFKICFNDIFGYIWKIDVDTTWEYQRLLIFPMAPKGPVDFQWHPKNGSWWNPHFWVCLVGWRLKTSMENKKKVHLIWLVVWTPLKNISQLGWLFPIYGKIKMFQTTNQ